MRAVVAVFLVTFFAAASAQANDLRRSMSGRLVPIQVLVAEPPAPERAARPQVTQSPLVNPTTPAPSATPVAEAAASAPAAPPHEIAETPAIVPAEKDTPPAAAAATPAPAASASAAPAQAPTVEPPAASPPPAAQVPPPPAPPAQAIPAPYAFSMPTFSMPADHLAAIGIGVIGGLVILDTVGVPAAAAAFIGGVAGQLWYSYNTAPPPAEYTVSQRVASRLWNNAAIRDDSALNRRWLHIAHDGGSN